MSGEAEAARASFARMRAAFLARLDGHLDEIEALYDSGDGGPPSAQAVEGIRMQAHRLAGTAATFGLTELGDAALAVDMALLDSAAPLSPDQCALVERMLEAGAAALCAPR